MKDNNIEFYDLLKTDMVVKVTGKVNIKEGEKPKILVNYIEKRNNFRAGTMYVILLQWGRVLL